MLYLSERVRSRFMYGVVLLSSLALLRCTSSKVVDPKDPVQSSTEGKPSQDGELPPELRDVDNFDPAATLDQSAVQSSDFYQIRKDVETNRAKVDEEWKAQDQLEDSIRKAKEDEEKKKKDEMKKEEESREKERIEAVAKYAANAKKRAKAEAKARDQVKKMPTITNEEVMWNGLED